jgi:ketol-acid reductoisomerase
MYNFIKNLFDEGGLLKMLKGQSFPAKRARMLMLQRFFNTWQAECMTAMCYDWKDNNVKTNWTVEFLRGNN